MSAIIEVKEGICLARASIMGREYSYEEFAIANASGNTIYDLHFASLDGEFEGVANAKMVQKEFLKQQVPLALGDWMRRHEGRCFFSLAQVEESVGDLPSQARCAIVNAFLDGAGRQLEKPVYGLFADKYPEEGPYGMLTCATDDVSQVSRIITRYFEVVPSLRVLKIKLFPGDDKGTPGINMKICRAVRDTVEGLGKRDVKYSFDANGAYDRYPIEDAAAEIAALVHLFGVERIFVLEQPLVMRRDGEKRLEQKDIQRLSELAHRLEDVVTIASDESNESIDDIRALHEAKAVRAVVLKEANLGGIGAYAATAAESRDMGLDVIGGCMFAGPFGICTSTHAAFAARVRHADLDLSTLHDDFTARAGLSSPLPDIAPFDTCGKKRIDPMLGGGWGRQFDSNAARKMVRAGKLVVTGITFAGAQSLCVTVLD